MESLISKIDEFLEATNKFNKSINNATIINGKKNNKIIGKSKKKEENASDCDTEGDSDVDIDLNEILVDDPTATTRAIDVWHKCQESKISIKQKDLYEHLNGIYGKQQKINRAYIYTGFRLNK
jgi:hypothetical protein